MDTVQKQTRIQSHTVFYSEDAREGVNYLMHLSTDEAKVFFDQAYSRGFAFFEDHIAKNYKLVKKNYDYELLKV
jgi:hypothetical protein